MSPALSGSTHQAVGLEGRKGTIISVSLPNGAIVELANAYGTPVAITAITNATEAVCTTATNTFAAGDYVEVTSSWSALTSKIVRVKAATTTSITLEAFDTTSTTRFSAGGGAGSVRKISGWTQLQQIITSSTDGGDQQFLEYQFLEGDSQKRIPTTKSAAGLTFSVADDPTLAGYIIASAANDDRAPRAVRASLPNSSKLLYNAYISLNKTPSLSVNEIMACQVTLSLLAEPVRYTS